MINIRNGIALVVSTSLVLFTSCIIRVVDPEWGSAARNIYHQSFDLVSGGTIQIENSEGTIDIRGWAREEVEISAKSEILQPDRSPDFYFSGRQSRRPKIQVDRFEGYVKIQSLLEEERRSDGTSVIHYELRVPRSVNLKDVRLKRGNIIISDIYGRISADVADGGVTIKNFSGALDLSVSQGNIEAEVLDLRQEDDIRISARRGNITLALQPEASVRLEASAPQGEVTSDIDLNQELPARKVSAMLNGGKTTASLTAFSGNIAIKKINDRVAGGGSACR